MQFNNVYIPYGGYWSTPFARWQGSFTHLHPMAFAADVARNALRERDIAVGIIMTFALGLGILFLSLYSGYAERVYSILFGQIVGISQQNVLFTALSSLLTLVVLLILYRPLLFCSFDPEVAEARGVPVNALGLTFLVLVAITVSIAVQIVGALLFFTLLIGPAATSARIVQRPLWAILLAIRTYWGNGHLRSYNQSSLRYFSASSGKCRI